MGFMCSSGTSLIIGINLAMETFPNFSQNTTNFPNSMAPVPFPKQGCESPDLHLHSYFVYSL